MVKKCRVITGLPIDGVGPSDACLKISEFWPNFGRETTVYAPRVSISDPENVCRSSTPAGLSWLPYRYSKLIFNKTETNCAADINPGEILYFWPGIQRLDLIKQAKSQGLVIVKENINTHTRYAKKILDKAYQNFGLDESEISEEMIKQEDLFQELADFVFAPSHFVEESLRDSNIPENKILASSYGCLIPNKNMIKVDYSSGNHLRFLFVGSVSIRKGAHQLLKAWHASGCPGELIIVGRIDKTIANKCRALLHHPSITLIGFQRNLKPVYQNADIFIFPSIEEGCPLVSFEAASFGLPMIVTEMGGGRIGRVDRNALIVQPDDTDSLQEAILKMVESEDLREYLGKNARIDSLEYDWRLISEQRHKQLLKVIG